MNNKPVKCNNCGKVFFSLNSESCPFCNRPLLPDNDVIDFFSDLFKNKDTNTIDKHQ